MTKERLEQIRALVAQNSCFVPSVVKELLEEIDSPATVWQFRQRWDGAGQLSDPDRIWSDWQNTSESHYRELQRPGHYGWVYEVRALKEVSCRAS